MIYELAFDPRALKEWKKLGVTVQAQFKKKIELKRIIDNLSIRICIKDLKHKNLNDLSRF